MWTSRLRLNNKERPLQEINKLITSLASTLPPPPTKSPFDIGQQQRERNLRSSSPPPIQIQISQPPEEELIGDKSENRSNPFVLSPTKNKQTVLEGQQTPSPSGTEELFGQMGKFKRGRGRGRGSTPRKWISVLRRPSRKGQPEPGYVIGAGADHQPSSTSRGEETVDTTDDSIILVSPSDSPIVTDRSRLLGGLDSGGGHYKSTAKPKKTKAQRPCRPRLFNSSSTSPSTSARSSNDTIDLVDDDDEDYRPDSYVPNLQHTATTKSADIIVLSDEDSRSDLQECTISTTTSVTPNSKDTRTENDCEIIAVKVVPKKKSLSPIRASRRKSPGNKSFVGRRSLSFNTVKSSVDRARRRISSSNLAKPSVMSHGIRKKKRKGQGHNGRRYNNRPQFEFITPVSMRKNNSKARPQRRTTSPVFVLDRELGTVPNPIFGTRFSQMPSTSWGVTAPTFIPVGGIRPSRFRVQIRQSAQQPVIPAGPNFLSVATNTNHAPGSLRPIVVDGSNVAMGHRGNKTFSCLGIQLCVEFFKRRGHEVVALVPQFRRKQSESVDTDILETMEKEGTVKFTPSREVGGQRIASYDDRFIIQYAHMKDAVIISNDNFKDIYEEEPEWRDTITYRLLQFTWMDESCIMFARDPMGRHGPDLEQFLRF